MRRMRCKLALIAFSLFTGSMMSAQSPTPAEVQEIAERAYIYAYPLVLLQATTSDRMTAPNFGDNFF